MTYKASFSSPSELHGIAMSKKLRQPQAHNQLGTPGEAESFLRGAYIFKICPISFKLCQTFFQGGKKI